MIWADIGVFEFSSEVNFGFDYFFFDCVEVSNVFGCSVFTSSRSMSDWWMDLGFESAFWEFLHNDLISSLFQLSLSNLRPQFPSLQKPRFRQLHQLLLWQWLLLLMLSYFIRLLNHSRSQTLYILLPFRNRLIQTLQLLTRLHLFNTRINSLSHLCDHVSLTCFLNYLAMLGMNVIKTWVRYHMLDASVSSLGSLFKV